MSKKVLVALDLQKHGLENLVFQNASTALENAVAGQAYYNTTTGKFCVKEGSSFVSFLTQAELETYLGTNYYTKSETYTKTEVDTAIENIDALPTQTSHSGEFLTTNGTAASWSALPTASTSTAGLVKVGSNLSIDNNGVLNATGAVASVNGDTGTVVVKAIQDDNTKSRMMKVWVGTQAQYDAIVTKDADTLYFREKDGEAVDIYDLLDQKQNQLVAGTNISLTANQDTYTYTIACTYELPMASASTLGGVKVGSNLSIDANGVLSASGAVASVNGRTGAVTLTSSDVGLGNVDNTSDLNKPISTATQTALDLKANAADVYAKTETYTKTEVNALVGSVYKYKGSVSTYADLPSSGQVEGDVYNVATADSTHGIKAGDNVAWVAPDPEDPTSEGYWDVLAGTVDLSAYLTSADAASTYLTQTNAASTYLSQTDAASTYATKQEVEQIAQGSVHKVAYNNTLLTASSGVCTWTIDHSLGADVEVTIKEVSTGDIVIADVRTTSSSVIVKFDSATDIAADTYRAVILG